jgi:two-component system sensor histidine kinase PilS (NtrC family)
MKVLAERRSRRSTDAGATLAAGYPESYWRSLYYFNVYRLLIALVLLGGVLYGESWFQLGSHDRKLFVEVAALYLLFGVASIAAIRTRWRFNVQIAAQVVLDIVFLTALIYASRGVSSGLGLLLLTTLAGAGLISRGRLALFFAALASIAVLLEHGYEVLAFEESATQFIQVGFLAIGYFATALVAHTLAQLTRQNEEIAAQRASDVANLSEVNRLVIQDMPDGVVVVDGAGVIRQVNTQAEVFLGALHGQADVPLADYAPVLATHLARWRSGAADAYAGYTASMDERHGLRFVPVGPQPDGAADEACGHRPPDSKHCP